MSEITELYDELDNQLENAKEYIDETIPMYSGYSELVDNPDAIKQELVKYSQAKSKNARYYSKVKSSLVYTREIEAMSDIDFDNKAEFEDKISYFRSQFERIAETIKNRLYSIQSLIESTRSLQSHMMSDFDF